MCTWACPSTPLSALRNLHLRHDCGQRLQHVGQQVLHGKHRLVFDLRFRAHLEEHDVLSTINTTRIRSPVLNGRLLDRDGEFVGGRGVDVRHVLEFTARNREHVLFRRSFENAHLNAKRHLHDRLGQIDRLDNARILESSGISESAHCQNEQEKYCEIPHDTLQNGVGSREICVDSSLPKSGLFLPPLMHFATFQTHEDFSHRFGCTDDCSVLRRRRGAQ